MVADFQNVYRCNVCVFSLVVFAYVLEHSCNTVGEKELSFVVGTCVFFLLILVVQQQSFTRTFFKVSGDESVLEDLCIVVNDTIIE